MRSLCRRASLFKPCILLPVDIYWKRCGCKDQGVDFVLVLCKDQSIQKRSAADHKNPLYRKSKEGNMAEFIKKLYRNQGIRYIFFGGCTTFVNLGSYALLRTVLGVDMTLANVLAIFSLSCLHTQSTNSLFFESRTHGVRELAVEMGSFIGMRLSTMFIEVFGVVFLSCLFGIPEVGSKLALQVVVLVLNYIFSKVFVFSEREGTGKSGKTQLLHPRLCHSGTDDRTGVCSQSGISVWRSWCADHRFTPPVSSVFYGIP